MKVAQRVTQEWLSALLMLSTLSTQASVTISTATECVDHDPAPQEIEQTLALQHSPIPVNATLIDACSFTRLEQLSPATLTKQRHYRYAFFWPVDAQDGFQFYRAGRCYRAEDQQPACRVRRARFATFGATEPFEVPLLMSTTVLAELLSQFSLFKLPEAQIVSVSSRVGDGYSKPFRHGTRRYHVGVCDDGKRYQYELRKTCSRQQGCNWAIESLGYRTSMGSGDRCQSAFPSAMSLHGY